MKRPTMLVEAILRQAELDLGLSVERDVATLRRRCKHEGLAFLTLTLPTLSDSLEQGLESGLYSCPSSFARHGRLPRFLGGFFYRVFTRNGELRDDACPFAVRAIRQLCRFFKKLKEPCSPARNCEAIQHFVDVEGELREATPLVERKDNVLDSISGIIWSQVFPEIDPLDLVCHHGPGATAERYGLNTRNHIRQWNLRMEYNFPSDLHCYPNYWLASQFSGLWKDVDCDMSPELLDIKDESPVRVVMVPKTQKAPRVIAIEPSHVQFAQQSVKDYVYPRLESHALTKHSIRFTRQDVNQELAHKGSIDKRTTTLDLKDASDRVHLHLVQRIFKTSGLLEYLEDARSLHASLPDGRNIVLFKYASMGSALCFPVEAMVFYTLVQSAMHTLDGIRPSSKSIRRYSRMISIYGDDIIVPVEYTDTVVRYLESYALKVNVDKSFSRGNFRESCGADYFKGYAVNPVYARQIPHDNARKWGPEHVMSWAATADLFYLRGEWIVAQAIREMVQRVVRRPIPKTTKVGSGVAFYSFMFTTKLRWNRDLQCYEQKRLHYDPSKKKDSIDGNELACLNKWGYQSQNVESGPPKGFSDLHSLRSGKRESVGVVSSTVSDPVRRERKLILQTELQHMRCSPESSYWDTISPKSTGSIRALCDLQEHSLPNGRECFTVDRNYATVYPAGPEYGRYRRTDPTEELIQAVQRDPLYYLIGREEGIDFDSIVKRGAFKSKHRWVSLA